MASAAILANESRPAEASEQTATGAVGASAWPAPTHHDYDAYRAEAHRLRAQAIKTTWLTVACGLGRILTR